MRWSREPDLASPTTKSVSNIVDDRKFVADLLQAQVLGAAWNGETREVRQEYKKKSDDIKAAFFIEHPNYQYKPRRSSEKKRRARRGSPQDPQTPLPVPPPMSPEDLEIAKAFAENFET